MKCRQKIWIYAAATLCVVIALWDQTPPLVSAKDLEETAGMVASDRRFTEKMEERLPPNAMIFQIPIMEFPESPVPGVGAYDHFRPYLYSRQLRFSFGSDKGRPEEKWQQQLGQSQLGEVVGRLESYGFSALYVNRDGFADKGEALLKALKEIGRGDVIESDQGDLFCVLLKPFPQPILPEAY
jgi:phosphoglycerol transferase